MPESRLGVRACDLEILPDGIEGLHFHSLCESRPEDLESTLRHFEERFGKHLDKVRWVNFGGGHLMTHIDYDEDRLIEILRSFKARHPHLRVILEPGSAFTWDTGVLVARVEDIVRNGGRNTLMLNVSFACHMPDCLEMPYKPTILGMHNPTEGDTEYWIGGNSCLAGDTMGVWATDDGHTPQIGERIIFRDMIHYTMVKTTMFNGVTHPSIALYSPERGFKTLRTFSYNDYKNRMG
jgi:carboxynorspermidine decarboxylase